MRLTMQEGQKMEQRLARQANSQATEQTINRALDRVYHKYGSDWSAFLADVKKDQEEAAKTSSKKTSSSGKVTSRENK
jgi:hypothetical protein